MEQFWSTGLIALVLSSLVSSEQKYIMEAPDCSTCIWSWNTVAYVQFPGLIGTVCFRHHSNGLLNGNQVTEIDIRWKQIEEMKQMQYQIGFTTGKVLGLFRSLFARSAFSSSRKRRPRRRRPCKERPKNK